MARSEERASIWAAGKRPEYQVCILPPSPTCGGVRVAAAANTEEGAGGCSSILRGREGASSTVRGEARWKGREVANLEKEAVPRQPELVRVRGEAQEVVRRDQVPEGGLPLRGHHMEDAALPLAVVPQLRGRRVGPDAAPEHAAPPREQECIVVPGLRLGLGLGLRLGLGAAAR